MTLNLIKDMDFQHGLTFRDPITTVADYIFIYIFFYFFFYFQRNQANDSHVMSRPYFSEIQKKRILESYRLQILLCTLRTQSLYSQLESRPGTYRS